MIEKTTDHASVKPKSAPVTIAVVIVPGPMNEAAIIRPGPNSAPVRFFLTVFVEEGFTGYSSRPGEAPRKSDREHNGSDLSSRRWDVFLCIA